MYGAHRSYSRNCGLGSRETDLLVSLVRRAGGGPPGPPGRRTRRDAAPGGLYGAKITGAAPVAR